MVRLDSADAENRRRKNQIVHQGWSVRPADAKRFRDGTLEMMEL